MALNRVEGVRDADVSYETGRGVVIYDTAKTSPREFIEQLERLTGFTAEVIYDREADPSDDPAERRENVNSP